MSQTFSRDSGSLIAAEKIQGADVYGLNGDKLGTINDIVMDKVSGRAVYAVLSFGGFLGMGEKLHPLPWTTLKYDVQKQGYVVALDKQTLEAAPNYDAEDEFEWTPDYGHTVDKYYGTPAIL